MIIQVIFASTLTQMWLLLPRKNRQFLYQRRHDSDPIVNMNKNKHLSIDIKDGVLSNVFT